MKSLIATFGLAAGIAVFTVANAATDPKLDFLGMCVSQGNSTTYCGCMTDTLSAKLNGKEMAVYLDYLKIIAAGERDQNTIIDKLLSDNKITGDELGRILKLATDSSNAAEQSCAGH